MKRILLLAFTSVFLVSCGVGLEDSSGPDVDRELKNQKLRAEYESVRGKYSGCIRLSQGEKCFPVSMYLWTGEVQEAPRPGDLKPGIRVVLRGRMMQTQFIGDSDNLIMTGQFDALTGRILLDPDVEISKTSTGCRLGGQDPITISANIAGDTVGGSILRNGQEWARLENMTRESRDVSTGSVLSEEQEYRRLQQIYEPVVGTYSGDLNRNVCGKVRAEDDFKLLIYIERVAESGAGSGSGGTCYVPRLTVRTMRNYTGELADRTYVSITRFDPEFFLPQFSTEGAKLTLDFVKGILKGEISTSGRWGSFELTRETKEVQAPEDETQLLRERLTRTYELYTGEYRGTTEAYAGDDWPVRLQVYLDEAENDQGIRVPVLMGLYTRPDLSDQTIGRRLMTATVSRDGCKPTLAMKADPIPGGRIPGVGLMRYTAEYFDDTKSMEGELVDHRGPQGILKVKKR